MLALILCFPLVFQNLENDTFLTEKVDLHYASGGDAFHLVDQRSRDIEAATAEIFKAQISLPGVQILEASLHVDGRIRPDLLKIEDLFPYLIRLYASNPEGIKKDLLDRGFDGGDLPILHGFAEGNPLAEMDKSIRLHAANNLEKSRHTKGKNRLSHRDFEAAVEAYQQDYRQGLKEIAVRFLAQISTNSSRVVLSYMFEKLGALQKIYYFEPDSDLVAHIKKHGFQEGAL